MRYAQIRNIDISNGDGIGVSVFVQGCHFHCYNCFNQETWDFTGGKIWNEEIEEQFFKLIDKDYVKRISILGGEPLCAENRDCVKDICEKIKHKYPKKKIWLYTGYLFEQIISINRELLYSVDVLVDGRYIDSEKDIKLQFRGSSNQRIIDIEKTLMNKSITLYKK